jgi:signal transduction histidine kinase
MRLTFRSKVMVIVGVTALAFLMLIAAGALISSRVERQLATIQRHHLPKVDLETHLESQFERLRRAFQDAVAIRDIDGLRGTIELKTRFLEQLDAAANALDPGATAALRSALADYYASAYDVSQRLIASETGEALVDALAAMQARQATVETRIKNAASLDPGELQRAFSTASRAESAARAFQLWISLACLAAVLFLSLGLSRGVLRAIDELKWGFERFGKGDFRQSIRVASNDEFADAAQGANRMAASLERLGAERDRAEAALKISNQELEAFSYSVAHDLRAPLRGINGFSRALLEDYGDKLDAEGKEHLERVASAAQRMGQLIDALLALSRVSRSELHREAVNLSRTADGVVKGLRSTTTSERAVEFVNEGEVIANGDPVLLRAALENLLGNAWKFTSGCTAARITFGAAEQDGGRVYYVQDNGAGFDMAYADKLFTPFQRLHQASEFAGTGIGLATVQRIVHRHGGRIWATGAVGQGATFRFTLPEPLEGNRT